MIERPDRTVYTLHAYVDPIFGDDTLATQFNPSVTPSAQQLRPLDKHPEAGNPKPLTGYLQHAPFAFKTLTGPSGALAWARSIPWLGTPWAHPDSAEPRSVQWVVIHCLPGLYGPGTDIDPVSGLRFNGEAWPAELPDFVSLQGTSSLDTIFDARGGTTSVIEVRDTRATGNFSHGASFIDSITIRGARTDQETSGAGAGIWIHSRGGEQHPSCTVRITNCVITDNIVGIALDSFVDGLIGVPQRPRIVNNTVAWNRVGLWAGEAGALPAQPSNHSPVVINNIFDSGTPPAATIVGLDGFQGLDANDLQVVSTGNRVFNPPQDFNAWEVGLVNRSTSAAANWPAPAVLAAGSPRVAIQTFTRGASGRGSLYVNDIFRWSPINGSGVEYSPHDFRLAPGAHQLPLEPGTAKNPLVNMGLGTGIEGDDEFPMTMGNQVALTEAPGLPLGAESAPLHGWDYDTEGCGNPRVYLRPGFNIAGSIDPIDLGADEMGELIIAGFAPDTRILTHAATPNAPAAVDHTRIFFFDEYDPSLPLYPRPEANYYVGEDHAWFQHVQAGSDRVGGSNYTDGGDNGGALNPETDRKVLTTYFAYPYFMRNLWCDFSPHPLVDLHPLWGKLQEANPTTFPPDVYGSNPWHAEAAFPQIFWRFTRDNPALFHNLGGTIHNDDQTPPIEPGTFGFRTTAVADGHLNPPGTFPVANQYLIGPYTTFGAFGSCTPSGTTYRVNTWGFGDDRSGCPDTLPVPTLWPPDWGIRFNCEVAPGTGGHSNLQTLLVIPPEPISGFAGTTGASLEEPRYPTKSELRDLIDRATEALIERANGGRR